LDPFDRAKIKLFHFKKSVVPHVASPVSPEAALYERYGGPAWRLHRLPAAGGAVCLDGSPGAFYVRMVDPLAVRPFPPIPPPLAGWTGRDRLRICD